VRTCALSMLSLRVRIVLFQRYTLFHGAPGERDGGRKPFETSCHQTERERERERERARERESTRERERERESQRVSKPDDNLHGRRVGRSRSNEADVVKKKRTPDARRGRKCTWQENNNGARSESSDRLETSMRNQLARLGVHFLQLRYKHVRTRPRVTKSRDMSHAEMTRADFRDRDTGTRGCGIAKRQQAGLTTAAVVSTDMDDFLAEFKVKAYGEAIKFMSRKQSSAALSLGMASVDGRRLVALLDMDTERTRRMNRVMCAKRQNGDITMRPLSPMGIEFLNISADRCVAWACLDDFDWLVRNSPPLARFLVRAVCIASWPGGCPYLSLSAMVCTASALPNDPSLPRLMIDLALPTAINSRLYQGIFFLAKHGRQRPRMSQQRKKNHERALPASARPTP